MNPAPNLDSPPAAPDRVSIDLTDDTPLLVHHGRLATGGRPVMKRSVLPVVMALAAAGPAQGGNAIHPSHPNGGGSRARLERSSYGAHEAGYGSRPGRAPDLFDWPPKSRDRPSEMLACDCQDLSHADGRRNRAVVFKSCFTHNSLRAEGRSPGNPQGPALTVWNARAAYAALLPEFAQHPDILGVCDGTAAGPESRPAADRLARQSKTWLEDRGGRLRHSTLSNVVVFDYHDVPTEITSF